MTQKKPTIYRWSWEGATGQVRAEPITNVVEALAPERAALPAPTPDPTDAGQPLAVEGETQWISFQEFISEVMAGTGMGEWLEEQTRLHGICSEPSCQWPIAAGRWCATCGRKLCLDHLAEHRNLHGRPA